MAIYINTAEGGTNGTTVTFANSGGGSGNAFDQVTTGVTYSTAAAYHGSLGYYTNSSATQYVRLPANNGTILSRVYSRVSDATVGTTFMYISQAVSNLSVYTTTGIGRIQVRMNGTNLATSPSVLPSNTFYRIEAYLKSGSGNGQVRVALYEGDDTTPWWDTGLLSNLTVETPVNAYYGKYDSVQATVSWDDVGLKTSTDAVWGAWPATTANPTAVSPKYLIVDPGTQFTLSGAGSTGGSGNTITGWQWTALWPSSGAPSLSGSTTQTATGVAGSLGDVYVYRLTVTNSATNTSVSTTNVLVLNDTGGGNQELVWNGTSWV